MSHYFSKQPTKKSHQKNISIVFNNIEYPFITDYGVFSKDHLDEATSLLIHTVSLNEGETVLDLGCGYGVIGLLLADQFNVKATLCDVNERAIELANLNQKALNIKAEIICSDGYENIDQCFNHIITNPPIRVGKEKLYTLLKDAKKHLVPHGTLWFVMHKKHGVKSAITFLKDYYNLEVKKKHKGFHVVACQNRLTR